MNVTEILTIEPSDILNKRWVQNADSIFLKDLETGTEFTYKEVLTMAQNLADKLMSEGIKEGDAMAISLNNSIDFAIIYFSCLLAKIVTVPLNPILGEGQKQFILSECNPVAVICSTEQLNQMNEWIQGKAIVYTHNTAGHSLEKSGSANQAILLRDNGPVTPQFGKISANQILTIVYTSGTTSFPKGVVHTAANLIRNATAFNEYVGINEGHRFYNHLPMTYLGGYYNLLILPFCAGASTVIAKPFGPEAILNFWDPIINSKVNVLWMVPTILHILNAYDRGTKGVDYCKSDIEKILCGTAPLHPEVRRKFTDKYGKKIYENFGLSETLFLTVQTPLVENELNNVGQILDFVDLKITNEGGTNLGEGEDGNIIVKTPTLMKGYYADWKEGRELLNTNWFDTGDCGNIKNNVLTITGRIKDIIIRGGINISPIQIEDAIMKTQGVKECAVVGVSDMLSGEKVIAYVTLAPESVEELEMAQIYDNCKKILSPIQQPDEVLIISEMPKSSTGKIRKTDLREQYGK